VTGIGLRLAQDIGAHRRKEPNHIHTPEDELLNRAFWCVKLVASLVLSQQGVQGTLVHGKNILRQHGSILLYP